MSVPSQCKFLVNVFSVSHQTHYVDLNTHFAKTWFSASDAERKMYEKLFLFRKTKNVSSIFGDRFVEWLTSPPWLMGSRR
jgi:bacteriorhodopsin